MIKNNLRVWYRGVRLNVKLSDEEADLFMDPENPTDDELDVWKMTYRSRSDGFEEARDHIIKLLEKNNESERFKRSFGWDF